MDPNVYGVVHAGEACGEMDRWDVSAVTSMRMLFTSAEIFDGDLCRWIDKTFAPFCDTFCQNETLSQSELEPVEHCGCDRRGRDV